MRPFEVIFMTVSAFKMNTFSNKYRILMDNLDLMFGHVAVNDNYRTSIKITAADLRGVFFFFVILINIVIIILHSVHRLLLEL